MTHEASIRVNFGRPMPVFPLSGVALLPQQVVPLHIFEPRYRQMVSRALDASGQIAIASFRGDEWSQNYHGRPPLRPAVCVGQIEQHERLADGRYNLLLQGVCRARIVQEEPPDQERLFREAMLEPVGVDQIDPPDLEELRAWVRWQLEDGPLAGLSRADDVLEFVQNDDVPTGALMEIVAFSLVADDEIRYRLLQEGNPASRGEILRDALDELTRLIRLAGEQASDDWPRGMSWN